MKSVTIKSQYLLVAAVAIAAVGAAVAGRGGETEATSEAAPHNPATATQAADVASDVIQGTVLEVINVPSYTYLRLQGAAGAETWLAVPSASIQVGERVRARSQTKMTNFSSPSLKRTFASIEFGVLEAGTQSGPAPAANAQGAPNAAPQVTGMGNPHGSGAAAKQPPPEVKPGAVAKAPGGYRIDELFARRSELAGKAVRVRGVVVKRTAGVMGKTFAHLRDGSGSESAGDHDLTITLQETPEVGQTVLVEGLLEVDRDFGSGYRYDVLVSDAKTLEP